MHQEVLTNTGRELFPYLSKFKSYYLAGGTAIALQIGHRISIDFDFFSIDPLPKTLYSVVKKNFPEDIMMASLKELSATKAYTIGRRGEYKDYIDLYYLLLEEHTSLAEIIEIANKKYKGDFNDRLFLEQLIYLDDISTSGIKVLKGNIPTKDQIKEFFKLKIKSILDKTDKLL